MPMYLALIAHDDKKDDMIALVAYLDSLDP